VVVDTHAHSASYLPRPVAAVFRFANRKTMPADVPFRDLTAAGVDAIVGKAVGDPLVTRWWRSSAWQAVSKQLERVEAETRDAGGRVVTGAGAIVDAKASGRLAVMLGVEGGDVIGDELSALDALYDRGVRLIVLVHLGDNQIGTTCLPWQRYLGPLPVRRRTRPGLTSFGRRVVERMNKLGMVIDVSHADMQTLRDIASHSRHPVVASHAGARALEEFERFLPDAEIRTIASGGGVIGLWPYRSHGHGVTDIAELVRHARHIADVAGAEHLCIGTDMNGVPGVMAGYRGERDLPLVTAALLAGGFGEQEVEGILGRNFLRVLERITGH